MDLRTPRQTFRTRVAGPLGIAVATVLVALMIAGLVVGTRPATGATSEERLAAYTLLLVIFTGVLALGTLALWWTTKQTLDHLEREFAATHRPVVAVRRIIFDEETPEHPATRPQFILELANVGDSDAVISELRVALQAFLPGRPPAWTLTRLIEQNPVASAEGHQIPNGGSLAVLVRSDAIMAGAASMSDVDADVFTIYCAGYVEYADTAGRHSRRTGFIRKAKFDQRWFEHANDPDFEYQD